MKKNIFNYPLMALLLCGLSMGFVACSDDDNNNVGSEVMNAEQTDEAVRAWAWVSVLTDETDQDADWQSKTYTATVGEPSSNNETARLIFVSNLVDAKARFANISGCKPEELNGSKTVSAGQFGSMTWNISPQGAANIATVEVNSPLLPRLSQLIFCTEEQAPDNASDITGNCYYRLGDVVEDKDGYYWVCVQPSFLGKKNKDSYWVNVFNANPETGKGVNTGKTPGIPEKNIYSKYNEKYNGNTILLPTGLKLDRRQIHHMNNLMWAVKSPENYGQKISDADVETGLGDLPKEYVGRSYAEQLATDWIAEKVFEKLFNCSLEKLKELHYFHSFYYGYHWKIGSTAGVWKYFSYTYEPFYFGSLDEDDTLYEMKEKGYGFDIRRYAGDPKQNSKQGSQVLSLSQMAPYAQFAGENGYWVVRVATGKQLDKKYDPYKKMESCYDIYNNNMKHGHEVGAGKNVPEMN